MTNSERLTMLARAGIYPVFITTVQNTTIAVTRTDQGYEARVVPRKTGTILAQGCASEDAAIKVAQAVLTRGIEIELEI